MQGYDIEKAIPVLARAMRKDGIRAGDQALTAFLRKAIAADFEYMHACGMLDENGLAGDGEYDEDDAFETILEMLTGGMSDDDMIDRTAQMLDSYMSAQADYLEAESLPQA